MKFLLTFLGALVLFIGCDVPKNTFTLINPSDFDRMDELIVLSKKSILEQTTIPDGQVPVVYDGTELIPSQLDDLDGDGNWDELAFLHSLPAKVKQEIEIRFVSENEYPEFEPRTNVRLGILGDNGVENVTSVSFSAYELPVPLLSTFQMDGIAWENDKVGFRQYFDGRNARDIFGKTSPTMALDTVGIAKDGTLEDNYHVMLPWGRDILAVGNSLGLGGLAIRKDGDVHRIGVRLDAAKNNVGTTSYRLITEGPVRSIFEIKYEDWNVGGTIYNLTNKVSIQAGSYGYSSEVWLQSPQKSDSLLVGLVNIHNDQPPGYGEVSGQSIFLTHDHQTYDDEWILGMALIMPTEYYLGYVSAPDGGLGVTNTFLNSLQITNQHSVTYHALFGWEISDSSFTDRDYFKQFVEQQAMKIAQPIIVK